MVEVAVTVVEAATAAVVPVMEVQEAEAATLAVRAVTVVEAATLVQTRAVTQALPQVAAVTLVRQLRTRVAAAMLAQPVTRVVAVTLVTPLRVTVAVARLRLLLRPRFLVVPTQLPPTSIRQRRLMMVRARSPLSHPLRSPAVLT